MLSKFILRAAVTATALTGTAGAASAEEFRVLMMDYAFFPETSYVQPGDTITFVNMSGITRVIKSKNGAWETAELIDGAEATVTVFDGMQTAYITRIDGVGGAGVNAVEGGSTSTDVDLVDSGTVDGQDAEEGTILGKLNFNGAPTSE